MPKKGFIAYRLLSTVLLILACCATITGASFAAPNAEGIQVYQKNVHLSPEHKQKLDDDITRFHNADNLWDVLREEFVLPHYEENPFVQEQIIWLMNNQEFLINSAARAAPYLYYILQQVRKRHLPAELVLIPLVESGYNPFAYSHAGASGLWQIMPNTASGYGIKQNWWYDGRRDVIASTRAALLYLGYLQNFFQGNWLLAMAAYNSGEGTVSSAIRRNSRDRYDTEFWSLPLPQETRNYVPRLLALAIIISHPDQYPIIFPNVPNAPYLAQVDVGQQINLKVAATFAGLSHKQLVQLNPAFKNASEAQTGPRKLMLPIENVEEFTENLARSSYRHVMDWVKYKVKSRETLLTIAKRFHTTISELKKLNHLSSNQVKSGTLLLIPNAKNVNIENDESEPPIRVAKKINPLPKALPDLPTSNLVASVTYALQPGDTVYMVRNKDTLASIAARFNVSVRTLQIANQLNDDKVSVGNQIIIPTHLAETKLEPAPNLGLSPGDTVYMVRRGDTMDKIAKKFKTTPEAIRIVNLMQHNNLEEGESIIVPTHLG